MDYYHLQDLVSQQKELGTLLGEEGPNLIKFIESGLISTAFTMLIESMELPPGFQATTFRSNSMNLN